MSLREELRMLGMTYIVVDMLDGYIRLAIRHTMWTLKFINEVLQRCQ